MSHYFLAIEAWFQGFALIVPLPWFVFVGSALEELVSLIPASLVMGLAGSVSLVRGYGIFYLMFLAFIGNIARLFGAYLYYWLGDRLEDILIPYFKRFLGVGHEEVEGLGKRFSGNHYRDGVALFFMRVTPFFPVTITSVACGVIKMNLKIYLTASFLGNFCKDFIFLTVGYVGLASMKHSWKDVQDYKWYVDLIVWLLIGALLAALYLHRGKGRRFIRHCRTVFQKLFK